MIAHNDRLFTYKYVHADDEKQTHSQMQKSSSANTKPKLHPKNIPAIGQRVLDNADFIRQLAVSPRAKTQSRIRRQLLEQATVPQLLTLVEICYNIIKARLPLSQPHRRALVKQAAAIRKLSRVRSARSARRLLLSTEDRALSQRGRGLPAIAAFVSSVLLPVLTSLLQKK